ncbi:conserved hypothetical protein [Roseiflexus castenholzii DSM 13941]|uniref:Uncharacterized protein n=2 Tax=Roseiflexaceae TaxID=1508635 RepID=A7NQF1_ROSCS|nr:conserved hypothetical protein [Roseiflexus castenholzii DSM 13941]
MALESAVMRSLTTWLSSRGPEVAQALDQRREAICTAVTNRLKSTFSGLLADVEARYGGQYQQMTFSRTPQRLHRLLLVALALQAPSVLQREIEWSVRLLLRHGITQHHIQSMVRWYFEAAQREVALDDQDRDHLAALEEAILATVYAIGDETSS